MKSIAELARELTTDYALVNQTVVLDLHDIKISIRSNSSELLQSLNIYFAHAIGEGPADISIIAINRDTPHLQLDFTDWSREPNKIGRKDAYVDLPDGRVIQKVRTGMIFLQSTASLFAIGPCQKNQNQLINYVNSQYMNRLQQQGALICHASAVAYDDACLAIAGFSGAGKSTLMLRLLEDPNTTYLSNDRLFLNRAGPDIMAHGIPKLPRVNPGTILHNRQLRSLIPRSRRKQLQALPKQHLWDIEEKYDIDLNAFYGPEKIISKAKLAAFGVLNWQRDHHTPCRIQPIHLAERPDILPAIMKSPGPFYQHADGRLFADNTPLDQTAYQSILQNTVVYEATGRIDFDYACEFYLQKSLCLKEATS